jgi:myosin heavy subunit
MIENLSEGHMVEVLLGRYAINKIYVFLSHAQTDIGTSILVSLNPLKPLPGLYDNFQVSVKTPHVYKTTLAALDQLRNGSQTILISGESGSGKTFNSRGLYSSL